MGAALLRRRPNQSLRRQGRRQWNPSRRGEGAAEGTRDRWYLCRQRRLGCSGGNRALGGRGARYASAIGTLLDAAEADTNETSRNILLGQVENLLHASGWEPLLVARLEEERGHTAEAREAYEQAGTAADAGGFCASRPSGRKRQRWTVTARTSSGCSRSTDSRQRGQPDSVCGCTSRNAAGWPKRWRKCATSIEPERRCPDRRRQRPGSRRTAQSAWGPGRSPPLGC